jgi:hypothetical protein
MSEGLASVSTNLLSASLSAVAALLRPLVAQDLTDDIELVRDAEDFQKKTLRRLDAKVAFPFMTMSLEAIEERAGGYNKQSMMSLSGGYSGGKSTRTVYDLRPVTLDIMVRFTTNDALRLFKFNEDWVFMPRNLRAVVKTETLRIGVQAQTSPRTNVAKFDLDKGVAVQEGGLLVATFIGRSSQLPVINTALLRVNSFAEIQDGVAVNPEFEVTLE